MISEVFFDGFWHSSIDSCNISIDGTPCTIVVTNISTNHPRFTHIVKFPDGNRKTYSDKSLTDILRNEQNKIKKNLCNSLSNSNSPPETASQGILDL